MSATDLCFLGLERLAELIGKGELSPVELTRACLDRIQAHDSRLNSFINLFPDEALARARQAEQDIVKGAYRGPLHGIPFGLKDLFMVKDKPLTLGTRLFHDRIAPFDSTVYQRLEQAGAILLGKQNLNPLAYGPYAARPGYDYGHTFNPWDPDCISGGSSGGSAAAVAAGFCPFSVGSDTGGSVRIPGAWCGLAAMKPTYGRISRYGVQALAWSLDHPGPMTRRVADCALVIEALSGHDHQDPSSAKIQAPDFSKTLHRGVKGLKIGLPSQYWELPVDPEVKYRAQKAVQVLEDLGAELREISWPMLAYAENTSNIILLAEASSAHENLVKRQGQDLWPALRLRLQAGLLLSAADYLKAQKARTLLLAETDRLFDKVDLLVGPAMPVTASRPGQALVRAGDREIGVVRAMTQYHEVFNLTGHPALCVPCGFSRAGLPIGLQLVGRPFDEAMVLQAGQALEAATGFWKSIPEL